jgi:hypothetical protein
MKIKLLVILCIVFSCTLSVSAKKTALIIGIGNYDTAATGWSVIHGNNDANLLSSKLRSKGFVVSTLIDKQATKAGIVSSLNALIESACAGDEVYLHFSGHGQLIQDMNHDEDDDFDQSFICYDACFSPRYKINGKSYIGQNHLIDDELFPMLNQLKQKVGSKGELVVIFDSCYSGGADRGEMEDDPDPDSEVEWLDTCRGTDDEFAVNKNVETYLRKITKPSFYATSGGHITVISACESDKRNYECKEKHSGKRYGSLSYCVAKLLDKGIKLSQWYDYFNAKRYTSMKIFRPSQKPVIERY